MSASSEVRQRQLEGPNNVRPRLSLILLPRDQPPKLLDLGSAHGMPRTGSITIHLDLLLSTGRTRVPLVLFSRLALLALLPVSSTDSYYNTSASMILSQSCDCLSLLEIVHPLHHDHPTPPLHAHNTVHFFIASQ